jgi:hypothetical protein
MATDCSQRRDRQGEIKGEKVSKKGRIRDRIKSNLSRGGFHYCRDRTGGVSVFLGTGRTTGAKWGGLRETRGETVRKTYPTAEFRKLQKLQFKQKDMMLESG